MPGLAEDQWGLITRRQARVARHPAGDSRAAARRRNAGGARHPWGLPPAWRG